MGQLICAFLSHTHYYWYDVGMLKVPGLQIDGKLENAGKRGPGGKDKEEWTDCVADDLQLFGVTGD